MSLRGRLVVALLALSLAGLVVTEVVTYTVLSSFLRDRIDGQLDAATEDMDRAVGPGRPPGDDRPAPPSTARQEVPPSMWGARLDIDGTVVAGPVMNGMAEGPTLPSPVPVGSTFEADGFRVRTEASDRGDVLVVATPLDDVDATLARLRRVEVVVTAVVLVGLALLAWVLVRLSLRPLVRMEETAEAIADGDLGRRIETTDPRTEAGRLGRALNVMLGRIEDAFAQRLEAEDRLRRFLADASHELRTPLTSIRGYAELFRRGADKRPEDLAKAMRRIEDEAARMGDMVEELLLLAHFDRGRALELGPVDLTRLAADAVDDARVAADGRRIELVGGGAVELEGDAARLRQVLVNLIGNALRHTPSEAVIRVGVRVEGGAAVLEVADEGPGLPEGEEGRVFEPFYRGDPARHRDTGGSGLGLAIVAAIVTAHHGEVSAASVPGQGATFTVRLPLATAAARRP